MNVDIFRVKNIRVNKYIGSSSDALTIEWATQDPGEKHQFGAITLYTKDIEFLVRRLQRCLNDMEVGADFSGSLVRDVYKND